MDQASATALWSALESGAWSVVDLIDRDRRRFLLARENTGSVDALTRRECKVVEYASLGYSNKLIAYELGIESSTVSTHLSNASAKLGLHTRTAIIQTRAALTRQDPSDTSVAYIERSGKRFAIVAMPTKPPLPASLSPAEREVVTLAFAAQSNAAIARTRGVSTRTVANQIASAMKKLGVGSRADMAAYLTRC